MTVNSASVSKMMKLASRLGSSVPAWWLIPASDAGALLIQRAMWSRVNPRRESFGVDEREGDGEAGDSSPGLIEAACFGALHLGWARGVVGDDHVDDAVVERLPEGLRLARLRMGGAHLRRVAPSGMSSAAKWR